MKFSLHKLGLAAALVASAGAVFAQQQQYGRDSVYASSAQPARPRLVTADTAAAARLGRDSVYATASSTATSPVATNAAGRQQHGRGSVYAIQLDRPAGDIGATRIGRAPSNGSTN
jgi:hypothetical protein